MVGSTAAPSSYLTISLIINFCVYWWTVPCTGAPDAISLTGALALHISTRQTEIEDLAVVFPHAVGHSINLLLLLSGPSSSVPGRIWSSVSQLMWDHHRIHASYVSGHNSASQHLTSVPTHPLNQPHMNPKDSHCSLLLSPEPLFTGAGQIRLNMP